MDDKQLVDQFLKHKSEKAFNVLYKAKTPHLLQIAMRLTAYDQPMSEDLIQEMWCLAIKKIHLFEWRSELKTWLTGILINLARNKWKEVERDELAHTVLIARGENSIAQNFITAYDLENAIKQLPAGYRQVIILHDIEGYKHNEIAHLLDINEGTSKSQLYQARKAMRNNLKEYTINEEKL